MVGAALGFTWEAADFTAALDVAAVGVSVVVSDGEAVAGAASAAGGAVAVTVGAASTAVALGAGEDATAVGAWGL